MRWSLLCVASWMIVGATALTCPPVQGDETNKAAGIAAPVFADVRTGREPEGPGAASGFFVSDHPHMGSFFFAEDPGDCQYTFPFALGETTIHYMLHDKLELSGSDKTGHYWQYRCIRSGKPIRGWYLPKVWYIPKDVRVHPGIWYQTDEPTAKPVLFGTASEQSMLKYPKN